MSETPRREPVEWICGLDPDPTRDGKGLARPFIVIWMREGDIIDAGSIAPALTAARIVASYLETTRDPKAGDPHVPDRIRVASPEVAEMLRAGAGPGVEVVVAPTPELDALQERIERDERRRVPDDGSGETYVGPGVSVGLASRFFVYAARLYRAAPWEHVPDEGCLIGVTCEKLGLRGAVVSVWGQDGEARGFSLYPSHQAFIDFLEVDFDNVDPARIPPHMALAYERGADVAVRRRKEVSLHGFEVAGAHAYPSLMVFDRVRARLPDGDDLEVAAAVASGLTGLVQDKPNLREGWRGKASILTILVQTTKGRLEMTLAVPHDAAEKWRRGLMKPVAVREGKKKKGS